MLPWAPCLLLEQVKGLGSWPSEASLVPTVPNCGAEESKERPQCNEGTVSDEFVFSSVDLFSGLLLLSPETLGVPPL